jgi:hypothetical protein
MANGHCATASDSIIIKLMLSSFCSYGRRLQYRTASAIPGIDARHTAYTRRLRNCSQFGTLHLRPFPDEDGLKSSEDTTELRKRGLRTPLCLQSKVRLMIRKKTEWGGSLM